MANVRAQLREMIDGVFHEIGQTTNRSQNVSQVAKVKYLLQRVQRELYEAHDWPQLHDYREIELHAGGRFYNFPDDLPFEHVTEVSTEYDSQSRLPVTFGITDTELALTTVSPQYPLKWDYDADSNQLEIWPVPIQATSIRVWGTIELAPFVEEDDRSTLHSDMIVLFAASELLAAKRAEDAQAKLSKANQLLNRMQGRSSKGETIVKGGVSPHHGRGVRRHSQLRYVNRG